MGTITINISDETERMFRESVKARLGAGKGKLGKAVDAALNKWVTDDEEEKLRQEAIKTLEKGLYRVGKKYTFRREEAYEDRIRRIAGTG